MRNMFLNNNTQNVLKKLFANPFQKKKIKTEYISESMV